MVALEPKVKDWLTERSGEERLAILSFLFDDLAKSPEHKTLIFQNITGFKSETDEADDKLIEERNRIDAPTVSIPY